MATDENHLKEQLRQFFVAMPHTIPIVLFSVPGRNDAFIQGTREFIKALREVTDKVSLKEFSLHDPLAKKWGITHSPTLIFVPDVFKIQWLGAPLGLEGQTFMEALSILGYRDAGLSDSAAQILQKLDAPREIKIFISPSCPYCPQEAVNALRAAVQRPDLVSLQIIDVLAHPDLADKYGASSVPQAHANGKLIGMGAQTEELFMASLATLEQQRIFIPDEAAAEINCDLVIVGGGPAGLTAGIYAARSGLSAVILEKGALGGQVATTPLVENYPGFTQIGGKTLVDIMVAHALEYVKIFPGEEALDIEKNGTFTVVTSRRRFLCRAVLLATGASYKQLNIPGEKRLSGRGISYCSTCDGPLFKGKKVLMVGGGDSAVTEALHLHNIGVKVSVIHRRQNFRAQEHLLKALQEAKIPVTFNTEAEEILGDKRVEAVRLKNTISGETSTQEVDGVFIAIGYAPTVQLAMKIGIELQADGYIKKDQHHRTNIPGIYSAGDVEGGYKQIVTAAGQGSEAALAIFEDLMNPYWKKKRLPDNPEVT